MKPRLGVRVFLEGWTSKKYNIEKFFTSKMYMGHCDKCIYVTYLGDNTGTVKKLSRFRQVYYLPMAEQIVVGKLLVNIMLCGTFDDCVLWIFSPVKRQNY